MNTNPNQQPAAGPTNKRRKTMNAETSNAPWPEDLQTLPRPLRLIAEMEIAEKNGDLAERDAIRRLYRSEIAEENFAR
jgi:hypothetical protein